MAVNAGLTLNVGAAATISTSILQVSDVSYPDSQLTFTVGTAPTHGTLSDNGTALTAGSTFTEADIDNGLLSYLNTDTTAINDSFTFSVSDGAGGSIPSTSFAITLGQIAPSFTGGADQSVLENSGAQTVPNWATNISTGLPDESFQTLNFVVTNNNNTLFAVQPAIDPTGQLTYTLAADTNGSATVTVQLQDSSDSATSAAQTFVISVNQIQLTDDTLTAVGSTQGDSLSVSVLSNGGGLAVTLDGNSQTYSMSAIQRFVFDGQAGAPATVIFDDSSDSYAVAQSLSGVQLIGTDFEFDANNAANVYIYGNSNSTATVNVANGTGSNFFVDDVGDGYSYIADPIQQIYSELFGFGSVTVSGSGGSTYAYIYSASHATVVGDPGQTTLTVGSETSTLSDFPQVYAVGASDGTDNVTLDSAGGTFVSTPSFSYVSGTASGSSFMIGALYCANFTAQAASTSDTAVFYSFPYDTFNGAPGTSELTGSTTNVSGSSVTFVSQASGYSSVSVFESGSGTDVANLATNGNSSFFSTTTASLLDFGASTITVNTVTVNTFLVSGGQSVGLSRQIVVTGAGNDTATIYDAPGTNALSASGSTATLTTSLGSVTINKFGSVTAEKQNGIIDTVHQGVIDFALSTVGNWTSD